jgi:hypothetical protein
MGRDDTHGKENAPVDFPEPVGLAWGSRLFDDPEANRRALEFVRRILGIESSQPAGAGYPAPARGPSER